MANTIFASDIESATRLLSTHGFVVLQDVISQQLADKLHEQMLEDAPRCRSQAHLCRDDAALLAGTTPRRYCVNDSRNWSSKAWVEFASALVAHPVLKALVENMMCGVYCDALGGDVVEGNCAEDQQLHEDYSGAPWKHIVATLCVSVALKPVAAEQGAMRLIPYDLVRKSGFHEPPSLAHEPDAWRNSRVALPARAALVRDVNCWHGGCSNLTGVARPLPAMRFVHHRLLHTFGWRPTRCIPASVFERLPLHLQDCVYYLWKEEQTEADTDASFASDVSFE